MKNNNSVLACVSLNLINTESVKLDCQSVVKFSHKWLQLKEPSDMENFPEEIQADDLSLELINNEVDKDPLLMLLCLLFEEKTEIPSELCQLYKEGLEILLNKWDEAHRVKGDRVYKNLSLQRKQDLLSKIALLTFEEGEFFFKDEIQQHIIDYLFNLSNAPTEPDVLQIASEAALKSIEIQHKLLVEQANGIYSFSDLRFHQYFVAREIAEGCNPHESDLALKNLVSHLNETRWREVFLLVVGMLRNADYLLSLMQQKTDAILAADRELQHFLLWLNQKSNSPCAGYKPSTFRAFYLEFILGIDSEESFEDNTTECDRINPVDIDINYEIVNFPFSLQQKAILKQYYDANKLLIDCLQEARYVSRAMRSEIEETLLVPSQVNTQPNSAIA